MTLQHTHNLLAYLLCEPFAADYCPLSTNDPLELYNVFNELSY